MIHDLYKKVAQFERELGHEAKAKSQCKNGCSKCCYTDISVFEIETSNIKTWFHSLSQTQQMDLKALWKLPRTEGSCAFLRNESCTIYEVRPLICRTQGLAFKFKNDGEEFVDICPLNDEMIPVLKDKEIINLDLLNMILSQLEKQDAKGTERARTRLADLKAKL